MPPALSSLALPLRATAAPIVPTAAKNADRRPAGTTRSIGAAFAVDAGSMKKKNGKWATSLPDEPCDGETGLGRSEDRPSPRARVMAQKRAKQWQTRN